MTETSVALTEEPPKAPAKKDRLKQIGELRDPILVIVTAVYVVGYLVWSINAYIERLGLLPALEPQYLVAGFVPSLLIFLGWSGRKLPKRYPEWISSWMEKTRWSQWVRGGVGIVFIVAAFQMVKLAESHSVAQAMSARQAGWHVFQLNAFIVLAYLFLIPGFTIAGARWLAQVLMTFMVWIYVTMLFLLSLFTVEPHLPQEFGGLRPRCAYLDVVPNNISDALRKEILPEGSTTAPGVVIRSIRLQSLFSDKEVLLVKPADKKSEEVVEIRRSAVQSITWCD